MKKKATLYHTVSKFLVENSDSIQKLATEHHKKFLGGRKFRSELIERYQINHRKIINELANNLEKSQVKMGISSFKKLAQVIADDSVRDGMNIEEAVDGIIFMKQALWEKIRKAGIADEMSIDDFYNLNQTIGTYVDVVSSTIAFAHHAAYIKKTQFALDMHDKEEKLKNQAVAYAEEIFASIKEPLMVLDKNLRVVSANKAYYKIFKALQKTTEGKLLYRLGRGELDEPDLRKILDQVLSEKKLFNDYEITRDFEGVGRKTMLLNGRRIDNTQFILLAFEDITKRKAAEQRLALTSAIVQSSTDAIIGKDLDGIIRSWNKGAENTFGYKAREVIGKSIILIIPKELRNEEKLILSKIRKGGTIDHFETTRVKKNGQKIKVSLTISPIKDDRGNIVGASKIARDITKQKLLERQKDDFMGIVSHELKTPVTSLKAYGQALQRRLEKNGDTRTAESLYKMDKQINKLTNLISDLLDITRIEGNQLKFYDEKYDFDNMVDDVIDEVQRTTERHVITRKGMTGDIVKGDRDRIGQVLTNMLINAIKFSPKSDKIIVKTTSDDNRVVVAVQDFGVGINKEKQKHIFERFYREMKDKAETFPGLGLGMYISRQIIDRQGGKIWLKSEKGKGSTFYFSLPLEPLSKRANTSSYEVRAIAL